MEPKDKKKKPKQFFFLFLLFFSFFPFFFFLSSSFFLSLFFLSPLLLPCSLRTPQPPHDRPAQVRRRPCWSRTPSRPPSPRAALLSATPLSQRRLCARRSRAAQPPTSRSSARRVSLRSPRATSELLAVAAAVGPSCNRSSAASHIRQPISLARAASSSQARAPRLPPKPARSLHRKKPILARRCRCARRRERRPYPLPSPTPPRATFCLDQTARRLSAQFTFGSSSSSQSPHAACCCLLSFGHRPRWRYLNFIPQFLILIGAVSDFPQLVLVTVGVYFLNC